MANFNTPSQVDANLTIGGGHPAPVQAPPATSGLPSKTSNSATGTSDKSQNTTPKKKDHAS